MIRKNAVALIFVLSFVLTIAIRWFGLSGENYRSIISSDGRGYYQYFESTLGSQSLAKQEANGTYLVYTPDSAVVNKYFVGLSVLWSPFILPVYAYYGLTADWDVNFYAEGFQKAISMAALCYLLLGLLAMQKLLQSFNFDQRVVNFTLFAFFFGSNLSYYSIIAPAMSHVYSFALIAAFLLYVRKFSIRQNSQYFLYAALIFGLIVLVRPLNGLILFAIPIVWKKDVSFIKWIKSDIELLIAAIFLIFMIGGVQLLFWYLQTGDLIQWSYAGEGFYFMKPHILDFLVSYRKGALVYTPILFVSFFGLPFIFMKNRLRFWGSIVFVLLLLFMLSSWWNWYYGDSYGSRVLIDFYPVFVIFLAFLLQKSGSITAKVVSIIVSLLIVFNVFQSYQYYHNIMSHYDMNREKYWYIFGKFGEEYENSLGGNDDIEPYHTQPMKPVLLIDNTKPSPFYRLSCDTMPNVEANDDTLISVHVKKQQFPCTISILAEKLMEYKALYAEMSCTTINQGAKLNDVYWTLSIRGANSPSHYYAFRINGTPKPKEGVREDVYRFSLPVPQNLDDIVLISLWNKGKKSFIISQLRIEVFGIKK